MIALMGNEMAQVRQDCEMIGCYRMPTNIAPMLINEGQLNVCIATEQPPSCVDVSC